jgi:alpha-N-arabinofuranosidase
MRTQRFAKNCLMPRVARRPSTLWQMTGKDLGAADHVGELPQVTVKEISPGDTPGTISVAPISLNFYRFPVVETVQ